MAADSPRVRNRGKGVAILRHPRTQPVSPATIRNAPGAGCAFGDAAAPLYCAGQDQPLLLLVTMSGVAGWSGAVRILSGAPIHAGAAS